MKKKILMTLSVITCAIALVVSSVVGTMAFLRAQAKITNTFSYGDVSISLDETVVDEAGKAVLVDGQKQRDSRGNKYKLVGDTKYIKDPIIHITQTSVPMYLFVKIDNGILGLGVGDQTTESIVGQTTRPAGVQTIHEQMLANGWKVYADNDNTYQKISTIAADAGITIIQSSTVYYLTVSNGNGGTTDIIDPSKGFTDIKTFDYFHTGASNVTKATMTAYFNHNAEIVVHAYAVQASSTMTLEKAANVFRAEHFMTAAVAKTTTQPGTESTNPAEPTDPAESNQG